MQITSQRKVIAAAFDHKNARRAGGGHTEQQFAKALRKAQKPDRHPRPDQEDSADSGEHSGHLDVSV